jgi:hypothetical protein
MENQYTSANAWSDFNDAQSQQNGFDLIPKGAIVPVIMTLKPGGHYDASQGWTDGYATQSAKTGAVYLAAEFVVTAGEYAKRKLWSNIGLYSPKGPVWSQMGRTFLRAALNSARNVLPQDNSPQASAARRIHGFVELDGLEFVVRVDIEKDDRDEDRNVVKIAIEPDHPNYARIMGVPPKLTVNPSTQTGGMSGSPQGSHGTSAPVSNDQSRGQHQPLVQSAQPASAQTSSQSSISGRPAWAQ